VTQKFKKLFNEGSPLPLRSLAFERVFLYKLNRWKKINFRTYFYENSKTSRIPPSDY